MTITRESLEKWAEDINLRFNVYKVHGAKEMLDLLWPVVEAAQLKSGLNVTCSGCISRDAAMQKALTELEERLK